MKILECREIIGGQAHIIKLDNGVTATAWNDKIEAGELMKAWSTKADVEVELKAYTSKAGKSGTNLVSFKILGENSVEVTNPTGEIKHIEVNKGEKVEEIPASLVIKRYERANSYEFGKAGNRFKVYFEDADDLRQKVNDLSEFMPKDDE